MKYGYDYCVSIPNYKPVYTSYKDTIVMPTPRFTDGAGLKAANMDDNMAIAGGLTFPGSSSSVVTTPSASRGTLSVTGAPQPHFHKHKRAHDHHV
jgi:hypothetical protein